MPRRTDEGDWVCNHCQQEYSREIYAVSCEQSHEIIYIPLSRSDLFRLLEFLYTGDRELLTESLVKTLMKYRRG